MFLVTFESPTFEVNTHADIWEFKTSNNILADAILHHIMQNIKKYISQDSLQ